MHIRLKNIRKGLKLSAEEVTMFSRLYGVSSDEILYGNTSEDSEDKVFARKFSKLSDIDKKEIMNLINFKEQYRESIK